VLKDLQGVPTNLANGDQVIALATEEDPRRAFASQHDHVAESGHQPTVVRRLAFKLPRWPRTVACGNKRNLVSFDGDQAVLLDMADRLSLWHFTDIWGVGERCPVRQGSPMLKKKLRIVYGPGDVYERRNSSWSPESVSMSGGVGAPEVKSSGQVTVTQAWPKVLGN
jgi:hypothetical protein